MVRIWLLLVLTVNFSFILIVTANNLNQNNNNNQSNQSANNQDQYQSQQTTNTTEDNGRKKQFSSRESNDEESGSEMSHFFQNCLPNGAELSQIQCSFNSSAIFQQDFQVSCVRKGIIRIVGEFDVITVRCVAPFHLDFDFDGFQPTEAIKYSSWKEIEQTDPSKKIVTAYHIVLKIRSNEALYKFFEKRYLQRNYNEIPVTDNKRNIVNDQDHADNNSSTARGLRETFVDRHVYPRTGNYLIRGMNNSIQLPFYLFFEENSLKEALIFNNHTRTLKLPIEDENARSHGNFSQMILVPCRPSHLFSSVRIYHKLNETEKTEIKMVAYEPWRGFSFPLKVLGNSNSGADFETEESKGHHQGPKFEFECVIDQAHETAITFSYPPFKGRDFGFEGIPPLTSRNNKVTMNHEVNMITDDPITVNITCVIQNEMEDPFLSSIGSENPVQLRLVREFILPGYGNNSYTVRETKELVGDHYPYELKIPKAFHSGISYCVSGKYSRIYEYSAGLNGKIYQLDFGTDYSILPHTSPPKEVHIHLSIEPPAPTEINQRNPAFGKLMDGNIVKLLIGQTYTFKCRIDLFTVAKTVVWDAQFKNGMVKRVKIDYDFRGEFSYYSVIATYELSRISCSAPYWNNNKWRTDDIETIVREEETDNNNSEDRYFIVGIACALLVIIMISFGLYCMRKLRENKQEFTKIEIAEFERGNPLVKAEVGFNHLPYDKRYEVTDYNIDYDRLLGAGEFGQVFQGKLNSQLTVAAKTVKPNMDKLYTKALLSELKIMIYLGRHENILAILGASTANLRKGSVFIFLEFCTQGSLESFLKSNRHQLQPQSECIYTQIAIADDIHLSTSMDQTQTVTIKDLYIWSLQIASGMDFISNKGVIHGDLATRNILLTENRVAKICDFGLSRRLHNYKKIYAKNNNAQPLPWPWLSPEALTDLTFSTLSDVWSFGITMWEIFTCADTPYPGMNCTLDFVQKLRGGLRNLKPDLASNDMYNLMKETWRFAPEDRPPFNEICFTLETMVAEIEAVQAKTRKISGSSSSTESGIMSSTSCQNVSSYLPHNLHLSMAN